MYKIFLWKSLNSNKKLFMWCKNWKKVKIILKLNIVLEVKKKKSHINYNYLLCLKHTDTLIISLL
jgi:hypothetical protein